MEQPNIAEPGRFISGFLPTLSPWAVSCRHITQNTAANSVTFALGGIFTGVSRADVSFTVSCKEAIKQALGRYGGN